MRKFILNKYAPGTENYYLEKLRLSYSTYVMLFILSKISFKSDELKVLCTIFSEMNDDSNDEYDESINNEIAILKIFIKYHSKMKK